jgi:hypothetical protein
MFFDVALTLHFFFAIKLNHHSCICVVEWKVFPCLYECCTDRDKRWQTEFSAYILKISNNKTVGSHGALFIAVLSICPVILKLRSFFQIVCFIVILSTRVWFISVGSTYDQPYDGSTLATVEECMGLCQCLVSLYPATSYQLLFLWVEILLHPTRECC